MKLWVLYVCAHRLTAVCAAPSVLRTPLLSFGHLPLKGKNADWEGSGFEVFLLVTIPQMTPQKHAGCYAKILAERVVSHLLAKFTLKSDNV